MKARWVSDNPSPDESTIGQTIVASWFPGRFHLVTTIILDGKSPLARLTHSINTGQPFKEIEAAPERFVTQIFRCDQHGFVRDVFHPVYEREHATREEAKAGHKIVLELFSSGKLRT
jgi:hypothetical protein